VKENQQNSFSEVCAGTISFEMFISVEVSC